MPRKQRVARESVVIGTLPVRTDPKVSISIRQYRGSSYVNCLNVTVHLPYPLNTELMEDLRREIADSCQDWLEGLLYDGPSGFKEGE